MKAACSPSMDRPAALPVASSMIAEYDSHVKKALQLPWGKCQAMQKSPVFLHRGACRGG